MSACPQWQQRIVEYVDGECSPEVARQVEQHLQHCAGCAQAVRAQRWVKRSLQTLASERAPVHLSQRLWIHTHARLRRARQWQIAVAVGIAVVAALLWRQAAPPDPVVEEGEAPIAQVVLQEYVDALSDSAFRDPSLQVLTRETRLTLNSME